MPVKEKYRALRSQKESAIVKWQKLERESAERWAPLRKQVEKAATFGGVVTWKPPATSKLGVYQDIVRFGGNIPYLVTEFPAAAITKVKTIGIVGRYEPTTQALVRSEFKRTLPAALEIYKRPSTYIIAAAMAFPIAKSMFIKKHTKVYTKTYHLRQKVPGKKAVEFGKAESYAVIHTPKLLNIFRGKKFIQPRVIQRGIAMKGTIIQKGQQFYTKGKIKGVQREILQAPKGTAFSRHVKPLVKIGKTWKFKSVKEIKGVYHGDIVTIVSQKGVPVLYSRITRAHIDTITRHTFKVPQYKLFKTGYKHILGKKLPKHTVLTRVKHTIPMAGTIERVFDTGVIHLKGRLLSSKVMKRYWEMKGMTGKFQKVPGVNLKYITKAYTASGKVRHIQKYKHVMEGTTIQMRKLHVIKGQKFYKYKGATTLHMKSPYKVDIATFQTGATHATRSLFIFRKKLTIKQRFDKYIMESVGKKGSLMLQRTQITKHHPMVSQHINIQQIAPSPIASLISSSFSLRTTYPMPLVSVAAMSVAESFAATTRKVVPITRIAPISRMRYVSQHKPYMMFQFAPAMQQSKFEQVTAQTAITKVGTRGTTQYTMPGGYVPTTPFIPPPPLPPPPPFFLGGWMPGGFSKGARKTKAPAGKHIRKYQPSIAAMTFGIHGEKPLGKLTGLEERPIVGKQRTPKGLNIFTRTSLRKFKRGKSVFEKQLETGFIRGRAVMEGF